MNLEGKTLIYHNIVSKSRTFFKLLGIMLPIMTYHTLFCDLNGLLTVPKSVLESFPFLHRSFDNAN